MKAEYPRSSGREMTGLIIILIGFMLLMNTMNIFPFASIVARYWLPALFIGIGAVQLSRSRGTNMFGGLFFMGFGALFFIGQMNVWNIRLGQMIGPMILVWIGLSLLMHNSGGRAARSRQRGKMHRAGFETDPVTDTSDFIQATAILGGFNRKCSSPQFRGGDITAIMGGGKIDLRNAQIESDEAVLDVFTFMGGMEIQVPREWSVSPRVTPILGGYEDRTTPDAAASKRLAIQGTAFMGGIIVTN